MVRSFVRGLFRGLGPLQIPFLLALLVVYFVWVIVAGFFAGLAGASE